MTGRWFVPLLLAGLALWSAARRWDTWRMTPSIHGGSPSLVGAMVGPVVLLTVAALLAMQAGNLVRLHRSWPILLVVWGTMLLLQRSAHTFAPELPPVSMEHTPPPVRSTSGTGSLGL